MRGRTGSAEPLCRAVDAALRQAIPAPVTTWVAAVEVVSPSGEPVLVTLTGDGTPWGHRGMTSCLDEDVRAGARRGGVEV